MTDPLLTTYFVWDGWSLIEERDSAGQLLAKYVHGPAVDEILMRTDTASIVFYHHDGLGSTAALTDAAGSVVESYAYDVYGAATVHDAMLAVQPSSLFGNRFLFTGREWIAEAGLYDYRNRAYSAELGRFLQTDPIRFSAGDVNLYRYVFNNPVGMVDPIGLNVLSDILDAISNFTSMTASSCMTKCRDECAVCCALISVGFALPASGATAMAPLATLNPPSLVAGREIISSELALISGTAAGAQGIGGTCQCQNRPPCGSCPSNLWQG